MRSWSAAVRAGAMSWSSGSAVGAEGWLMLTWPVMVLPSARPAEMWCVKLELMAGRTETDGGMEQITESR